MMKVPPVLRVAVCAALVALGVACAGLFATQPVAAQGTKPAARRSASERGVGYDDPSKNISPDAAVPGNPIPDQQMYRPGLRNSFVGHPLSAKELNLVLTQLRDKTGFVRMRFDDAGFLTIDDRSQVVGGSSLARELLLAAVDGNKSVNLQSHNRSPKVLFARVGVAVKCAAWRSHERMEAAPVEIDFADFSHLRGPKQAVEAFDLGFAVLHELCHAVLELRDSSARVSASGDCESYINRIRRELGVLERQQYVAGVSLQSSSASHPAARMAELVFAQTKPGRKKTKTLRLKWDEQQVGNIR